MKVIIVTGKFPAISTTFVTYEASLIKKAGYQILIIASQEGDLLAWDTAIKCGITHNDVLYVNYWNSPLFSFDFLRFTKKVKYVADSKKYGIVIAEKRKTFFSKLLKNEFIATAQLIHAHFVEWASLVAMPLSYLLNIPFTFTAHDSHLASYPSNTLLELQRKAAKVFLVSPAWKALWVKKTGSSDKLKILPNAVIHPDTTKNIKNIKGNNSNCKLICVSRLVVHKRLQDAIRLVYLLKLSGCYCILEIIGDGPEKERLKILANQLGVANQVIFYGFLSHEEVFEKLSEADIFLHFSERESFGVVIIEAMAMGLPVVVAQSDGPNHIVLNGHTGFLFPTKDVLACKEIVIKLLKDTQLRYKIGEKAKEFVFKNFSWDLHMELLFKEWDAILLNWKK